MFNPSPNGARFIIHGQDDKTIYADVDTTEKIDPLPDSDVEDDQNNSKSNKSAEWKQEFIVCNLHVLI